MNSIKIILIIGVLPLMISCGEVFISTPQPVDSKNIYLFPRGYRGMWTCEADTVIVGKDYFKSIQYSDEKVSKQEADTSSSYLLKDNKIYTINTKGESRFKGGFPYKLKNDTIYFQESEVMEIALGKRAFLRRVKKNYILNIKQENQWWQVILIKKDEIGNIIVGELDMDDLEKYTNYKHIYTFEYRYLEDDYIEANWTKKELLEMINKGSFLDTLAILRLNKTFCN